MTLTLDLQGKILKLLYHRNGRVDSLGMKGMWVGYNVGCTMGLTLGHGHGHGACQIDRPSNGSMWNFYSFKPVGQWMGYSFTDLGAEGCCRSLNALGFFLAVWPSKQHQALCIISSPYVNSNWMVWKRLNCVLTSVTLTLTFCLDLTSVIGNNSWKFHDDNWYDDGDIVKKCGRRMDRWTDWTIHRAAWSQLKMVQKVWMLRDTICIQEFYIDFLSSLG